MVVEGQQQEAELVSVELDVLEEVIVPVFLLIVKLDEGPRTLVISRVHDYFLSREYRQMSTTQNAPSGNTAGSGQIAAAVKTNNVQVSLRVNVEVSGNVEIFTESGNAVNNVVNCNVTLPPATLYTGPTVAVLEFWEPSGARGDISGAVAGQTAGAGQGGSQLTNPSALHTSLTTSLASIIAGAMDASAASPFNGYSADTRYTRFDSFGDLALGAHAHYLFGHVAATSAIDNDLALINYFKNNDSGSAQIATLLVAALKALSDSNASGIVRQVISQDPSRASGQDNNQLVPDVHQGLLFAAGDVVYMQVNIKQPSLSSTLINPSNSAVPGAGSATALPAGSRSAFPADGAQFTLKITLA
jgi:hypothetical protein